VTRWPLAAVGLLLVGCPRKAPGPQECHRFALQVLGLPETVAPLPPPAQTTVDELTRECVTTPFDRTLLRCVDQGSDPRRCLAQYQLRTPLRPRREPP
jgi:hypothetical protein